MVVNLMGLKAPETIERVKDKIQDRERIPKSLQQLHFRGVLLEDSRTPFDYNIHRADILVLSIPFGCGFGGLPSQDLDPFSKYLLKHIPSTTLNISKP